MLIAIVYHHRDCTSKLQLLAKELLLENIRTTIHLWGHSNGLNFKNEIPDAVLVHANSPHNTILRAIPEFRRKKYKNPIIVIDENDSGETKREAFTLGACGYWSEPFSAFTLAVELKKIFYKKAILQNNRWLKAYDLSLDLEQRFARRNELQIKLRNKEFSLLEFFIINRGKIVTRNAILEHVWDRNANFASNTVDVHINRLRRKIDDPFDDKLIHTVHCVGYLFDKKRV